MGCCISKCSPPDEHEEKLVICRPIPQNINKISPTSSTSSFTCNTILTSASSLSTASSSSALTSKDRSFSNDFLWSCYKDNPHVIRIKEPSLSSSTKPPHIINTCAAKSSLAPPPKLAAGPQKRLRSSSPANLTRQKSMRKEAAQIPNSAYIIHLPTTTLRSPSPSRTFDGATNYNNKGLSKPRIKASSPNRSSRGLRHTQNCSYSRVANSNSKIQERVVKQVECKHDIHSSPVPVRIMEDIHNPLISFDCFIFL